MGSHSTPLLSKIAREEVLDGIEFGVSLPINSISQTRPPRSKVANRRHSQPRRKQLSQALSNPHTLS